MQKMKASTQVAGQKGRGPQQHQTVVEDAKISKDVVEDSKISQNEGNRDAEFM